MISEGIEMKRIEWIFRLTIFALFLSVSLPTSAFSTRTESWKEDALLHDGRIIKVNREVGYTFQFVSGDEASMKLFASWPDKFWLKFEHPDTHETIKWQGEQYFYPVLLDIVDGVPYLVVMGRPDKENESIYGCPELPYIYLKYEKGLFGKWTPIPVEQAPSILQDANLSPEYPDFPQHMDQHDETMYEIYNHRSSRDLSHDQVQKRIWSDEKSRSTFQAKIPRNYGEWHNIYKDSYLNERRQGDCRPPRALLPQVVLPTAIEGTPEILETINYTPDRIAVGDDWSNLVFDQKREGECKKLFRPTDPNDYMQGQRFVNDSTGKKPAPYSRAAQFNMGVRVLCDDQVWFVTHQEEPGKIIISKFTVTGDLVYRTSFRNPDRVEGFVSYIRIPSLRSKGGYLYFDWLDFRDVNREWHIKRWVKMRMREPASQNINNR
jgi:hypothetical protein